MCELRVYLFSTFVAFYVLFMLQSVIMIAGIVDHIGATDYYGSLFEERH